MGKKEKPRFLDYLNAVKKADREREIAQHGKLISTRPLRIVKSKKVYDRKRDKRDCSKFNDGSLFFFVGGMNKGNVNEKCKLKHFQPVKL